MNTRYVRSTGWAANFRGITAILGLLSMLLFFVHESAPIAGQDSHF